MLALVHDGFLWLSTPIPINDLFIWRITTIPYQGVNPADAFVRKSHEKNLADEMKNDFGLVKKSRGYNISYVNDQAVCFYTHILAGKITKKCQADEVSTPVVSLVAQCRKRV